MTKRGKVLRNPLAGVGLVIAEGRQYQFALDGIWKSDIPPKPGLVVDVDFDVQGKIAGITAVPDSQLCKEQAKDIVRANKGPAFTLPLTAFVQAEPAQLIVAALLVLSWFLLTAVSVEYPFTGTLEFTFWQLLRSLGSGAYRVFALLAVIGPFVHCFWKDRQAAIAGLLPLFFMGLTGVLLVSNIDSLFADGGNRLYQQMPKQSREYLMNSVSFGPGTYVSIILGVYFAFLSVRQFRQWKPSGQKEIGELQKTAA